MRAIAIITFFCLLNCAYSQQSELIARPTVDNRMELLSIVFRLAGSDEYNMSQFEIYTKKVDEHYTPYRDHPLIAFVKAEKEKHGIAYDAVMSMAIHLDTNLNPLIAFSDDSLDPRWANVDQEKFVSLLKEFYNESNSEVFFDSVKHLQSEVRSRYQPIYQKLDAEWFSNFFGNVQNEQFHIAISLANGGANYGTAISFSDGKRDVYAIIGTWDFDSTGIAKFPFHPYFLTMVHEFSHSFVNPLIEVDKSMFEDNGIHMFSIVKKKMQSQSYQEWETMFNEALVRATVIKYMKDHDFSKKQIENEIKAQYTAGFYWVDDLVIDLEKYSSNRSAYPTFVDFLPELATSYEQYRLKVSEIMIDNL